MNDLPDAPDPLLEGVHQLKQATESAAETLQTANDEILAGLAPIQEFIAALVAPLQEQLNRHSEAIRAVMSPLLEGMCSAEQVFIPVLTYLLNRGWYITYDFPILALPKLHANIQAGDHEAADAFMVDFVRGRVDATFGALAQQFPDRAAIFADALYAHRGGKYTLTVPVLLAQADGIGCKILDLPRQFFPHNKRITALDQKLNGLTVNDPPRGVVQQMLYPLTVHLSVAVDTNDRDKRQATEPWYGPLNRHGVLHGHDTDYATEENSLRCVLLLQYLLDADRILRVEISERRDFLAELEREPAEFRDAADQRQ